jgi:HrpA-like RNA helicase
MALNDKFSEKTVREDLRIKFTRQLYKLREGDVKEVVFPNDLTGVERKFLHKLAEELGLKSKSNGKGNDRRITVTKPSEDGDDDTGDAETPLVTLNQHTLEILNRGLPASLITEVPASSSMKASDGHNIYRESSKPSSLIDDISAIEAAYNRAQAERVKKPTYEAMARKRASLPAFYHQAAVSTLIKEQQIVLISGETGCGEYLSERLVNL